MPDPLSIAAAVTGIAATGFAVANGLYTIADGIGSAGQEVRIYGDEVGAFSKLLIRVRSELLQPAHTSSEDTSLIKDVLDICDRILAPLERLQTTLSPLLVRFRESPGKLRQVGIRIHWIFSRKAKLLFYREVLRGQHRVLDTTLELMILKVNRDKSPQNVYILQMSLEHSMTAVHHSLKSTNVYQLGYNQPTESKQMLLIEEREDLPEVPEAGSPDDRQILEGTEERSLADSIVQGQGESDQMTLVLSTSASEQAAERLDEEEIQQLDEKVDQDLSSPSYESHQELLEDMRSVSRKVLRRATRVLQTSQRELELENERLAGSMPDEPIHALPTETPASMPAVTGVPTREEEAKPHKRDLSPEGADVPDNIITLENADGESYDLPYLEVRTWENMCNVINEIFKGKWPIEPDQFDSDRENFVAIKNGDFLLYGPSRQIILPRMWSRLVRPGWVVKLRYKQPSLNPQWLLEMDDRKRKEEYLAMKMRDMEQEAEQEKFHKNLDERRRKDADDEQEKRLAKKNADGPNTRDTWGEAGRWRLFKKFIKGD